jgi:serine/threonine-protein kinase HipA
MMKAAVFRNRELVGTLIEENHSSYIFRYDDRWFADAKKPAVSLTLPKTQQEDFVELAKRIGVQEKRIEKLLTPFLAKQDMVESLAGRSFLHATSRKAYLENYRQRRNYLVR